MTEQFAEAMRLGREHARAHPRPPLTPEQVSHLRGLFQTNQPRPTAQTRSAAA